MKGRSDAGGRPFAPQVMLDRALHPVLWCSLACSGSTGIYGPFDHIGNIFCGFCFSFFFKVASEVLKLIAQLVFTLFWVQGGYFV